MVANRASNRCASDAMMAGDVSCQSANRGTFNATFSVRQSCT
jgi:hypothetical protein